MATRKNIQNKTLNILREYSIEYPPIPVHELVEKSGIYVQEGDFGHTVSGLLLTEDGKNIIGLNRNESPVRKRFTLAHELGHYFFHRTDTDEFLSITKINFRNEESSSGEKLKEREANYFAANLLMPEFMLKSEINKLDSDLTVEEAVSQLALIFQVSEAAMTYRLTNLKLIY